MPGYIAADRARNEVLRALDAQLMQLPAADKIAVLAQLLNDVEDRFERACDGDEEID